MHREQIAEFETVLTTIVPVFGFPAMQRLDLVSCNKVADRLAGVLLHGVHQLPTDALSLQHHSTLTTPPPLTADPTLPTARSAVKQRHHHVRGDWLQRLLGVGAHDGAHSDTFWSDVALLTPMDRFARLSVEGHGARLQTENYTRGCHWIPRMLA
jgi:hypothetical protein